MFDFRTLDRVDRALRNRVEKVATKAALNGDRGVVEMLVRATDDALALGRMRDRDVQALERLEDTYGHKFYNGGEAFIYA